MPDQIHIIDAHPETESTDHEDTELPSVEPPSFYDDATEPPWADYGRRVGAFLKALLPAVGKEEFLDDRRRTWHTAVTHEMDVYTADEFDRVVLDTAPTATEADKQRLVDLIDERRFRPRLRNGRVESSSRVLARYYLP
jgi:hypothetical protein